jgi:hypothetical protein
MVVTIGSCAARLLRSPSPSSSFYLISIAIITLLDSSLSFTLGLGGTDWSESYAFVTMLALGTNFTHEY